MTFASGCTYVLSAFLVYGLVVASSEESQISIKKNLVGMQNLSDRFTPHGPVGLTGKEQAPVEFVRNCNIYVGLSRLYLHKEILTQSVM